MKIGVVGAGSVGTAIAKRLVPQGHEVMLSYSRDVAKLESAAKAFGAITGSPADAVRFGDVVALAVPWSSVEDALKVMGSLNGKVLWDCTNSLKEDFSGLALGTTTSGAEALQRWAIGARVVKGIPPFAKLLHSADPTIGGKPAGTFMCGDDELAKSLVRPLLEALPSAVVDVGPLENARYVEPAGFLLVRLAYGLGFGSRIGLALLATELQAAP